MFWTFSAFGKTFGNGFADDIGGGFRKVFESLRRRSVLQSIARWFSSLFGEWLGMFAGIWLIRLVEIRGSIKGLGVLIENAFYRIAVG